MTAHDLARFYRAMLAGGELAGVRVASAETIDQMRAQSSVDGEPDGLLHYPVRFGRDSSWVGRRSAGRRWSRSGT